MIDKCNYVEFITYQDLYDGKDKNGKDILIKKDVKVRHLEPIDNIKQISECVSYDTLKVFKNKCMIFRKDEDDLPLVVQGRFNDIKRKIFGKKRNNKNIGFTKKR